MLRFFTAGESHGPGLISLLEGMPAGLPVDIEAVNADLWRRQQGYGRGNRQKIERDQVEVMGGIRHGVTTGAPIAFVIRNRDFANWQNAMSVSPVDLGDPSVREELDKKKIERFRPGHADLAGTLKYRHDDIRDVLERASARETAARVAAGAVCRQFLEYFGIRSASHVMQVGSVRSQLSSEKLSIEEIDKRILTSKLFCIDDQASEGMKELIKDAWQKGDSLGGIIEVLVDGLPVGLGSYTQWDRKLDGLLAQAILSTQAMKAVEIGDGMLGATELGSNVHDALFPAGAGGNGAPDSRDSGHGTSHGTGQGAGPSLPFQRHTNHAGGLEGGMTNGSRLVVRGYMKPIPTMRKGLESLSFPEFQADRAHYERSDVCAIAAASVVLRAMVCLVLANAVIDKFAGDSIVDLKKAFDDYSDFCRAPFKKSAANNGAAGQRSKQTAKVEEAEPEGNEDAVGEF
ncbi:MAG TPA: chorismate synthase [Chroococcales cyanobacterium]